MSITTRSFEDGKPIETLRGSDGSVTRRVLEAQSRRIEAQIASNAQPPLFTWAGDGRIQAVGGNGPLRPRGVQANSGLGQGDPVQVNGGLVAATPTAGNLTDVAAQLRSQADSLARVAKSLAAQFGNGDPNAETTPGTKDALPRYPDDTYYDLDSGTLFRWDSTTVTWVPLQQVWQGFTGAPMAAVFVEGALAIADDGTAYTGATPSTWTPLAANGTTRQLVLGCNLPNCAHNAAYAVIDFSTNFFEPIDTDGFWSAAQPTRFYFPVTGMYRLTADCSPDVIQATGQIVSWAWEFRVYNADTTLSYAMEENFYFNCGSTLIQAGTSGNQSWNPVFVSDFRAGEYMEIYHRQENTNNVTLGYGGFSYLHIELLGEY